VAEAEDGWRGWTLEALERAYSPSTCVDSIDPFLAAYADRSAEARQRLPFVTVPYGDAADEVVDVFPAAGAMAPSAAAGPAMEASLAPLIVFIHGGYWQQLGRADASFGASQFVPAGIGWAAIEYTLAPAASLAAIVDQCRRAVRRLLADAIAWGFDPARIWLAGSSAGAHLAAMALLDPALGLRDRPAGAFLLSGIYDLRPLVPTYVNQPLGLDDGRAWALSPLAATDAELARLGEVLLAFGEHETPSFKAQSRAFAKRLSPARAPLEVAGRNHFDIVFALGEASSPLGSAVRAMVDGPLRDTR
jgi:arylformamidase